MTAATADEPVAVLQIDPSACSRLTTAFVTNDFVCGPIGSALASVLW
jgi:hypothetical protein